MGSYLWQRSLRGARALVYGALVLLTLCAHPAAAQTRTIVSGTIVDPNGIPYSGATLQAILVSPGGPSPSLTPCANPSSGCPVQSVIPPVTLGPGGQIPPFGLWANASILPSGTSYTLTVTEPGVPYPLGTGPQVCTVTGVTIAGAAQSVTSLFNACPDLAILTTTGMIYPAAGIPDSTGSAWGASYSVSGSGNVCLTISCVMTTPNLGTPSAAVLTNATGLPVSTGLAGLGTGVAAALALAVNGSGALCLAVNCAMTTPNLGTPSAVNLANALGLPFSTGLSGFPALCTGSQFSQGVSATSNNCATPAGNTSTTCGTTLGSNTAVGTASAVAVMNCSLTVPSSGGPYYPHVYYTLIADSTTGAVNGIDSWVTDNTTACSGSACTMGYYELNMTAAMTSSTICDCKEDIGLTPYPAGTGSVQFTVLAIGIHATSSWTINAAGVTSPVVSNFKVELHP